MPPQVEELPDNKVRLTVDVPGADVHHAVEHAASDLAASVKIPGFRKGKVPMPVLVSRIGRERLFTEAIETHIAGWYGNAVASTRIRPAEQPELDYELPASEDEDWRFTATVAVLPTPSVADWKQLQVPYAEPEVPADYVDHELSVLRSTVAELSPVDNRPAQEGDTVVIDLVTDDDGGGQRDYVVELGTGRLLPELEEQLVGMQPSGGSLDAYLQLSGESAEALVARLREQAIASVAGEMLLEAAADELGIAVDDDEVDQSFRERFEDGDEIIAQAKEAGAYE